MSEKRFVHADIYADHAALLNENQRLTSELEAAKDSLRQVDEVLVVNWVGPRKDGDYTKALADLVTFNIQIHDDPQVSEVAAKRKQEYDALREGLKQLVMAAQALSRNADSWEDLNEALSAAQALLSVAAPGEPKELAESADDAMRASPIQE